MNFKNLIYQLQEVNSHLQENAIRGLTTPELKIPQSHYEKIRAIYHQ